MRIARRKASNLATDLEDLDTTAERLRQKIEKAHPTRRPLTSAEARKALADRITDDLVNRVFCPLLCTADGPSCDRDPLDHATPYPVTVLRRCWVDALLNGWALSELHIHRGYARRKWPPLQPGERPPGRDVSELSEEDRLRAEADAAHAAYEGPQ